MKKADAITPVGGGEPIPPRPARVPIRATDQQKASDEWDAAMKRQGRDDLVGMLDAEVIE